MGGICAPKGFVFLIIFQTFLATNQGANKFSVKWISKIGWRKTGETWWEILNQIPSIHPFWAFNLLTQVLLKYKNTQWPFKSIVDL